MCAIDLTYQVRYVIVGIMKTQMFSGVRLEALRNERRLTQHDLASRLRERGFGTTQTTVSRWESGQHPNGAVLPALAAELGCAIADLYGDDEDEEAASMSLSRDEKVQQLSRLLVDLLEAS